MVYRVECRPLFRTVWSAAALRLGDKRFALAIVFHVGGGLGMRKVTPQPEMSTPSRVHKHGSMGSCWLPMVTGETAPSRAPLKQFVRSPPAPGRPGVVALNQTVSGVHCTTTGLFAGCMSRGWFQHDVGPFWNVAGGRWDPTSKRRVVLDDSMGRNRTNRSSLWYTLDGPQEAPNHRRRSSPAAPPVARQGLWKIHRRHPSVSSGPCFFSRCGDCGLP